MYHVNKAKEVIAEYKAYRKKLYEAYLADRSRERAPRDNIYVTRRGSIVFDHPMLGILGETTHGGTRGRGG